MKLRFTEMLLRSSRRKRSIVTVGVALVGAIGLLCASSTMVRADEDGAAIWRMFNKLLSNQRFLEYLHATDDPSRFPIQVCWEQISECRTLELGTSGKVTLSGPTKNNALPGPLKDVVYIGTRTDPNGSELEFRYSKEGVYGHIAFDKKGNIASPIEFSERR